MLRRSSVAPHDPGLLELQPDMVQSFWQAMADQCMAQPPRTPGMGLNGRQTTEAATAHLQARHGIGRHMSIKHGTGAHTLHATTSPELPPHYLLGFAIYNMDDLELLVRFWVAAPH